MYEDVMNCYLLDPDERMNKCGGCVFVCKIEFYIRVYTNDAQLLGVCLGEYVMRMFRHT